MIEAVLELIFGVVGELLLEIVVEVLVEIGFHGTAERLSSKARSRVFVGLAYALFGAVLGFASLCVFPRMNFGDRLVPAVYFILSPIVAGLSLTTVSWMINRGIRPVRWFELDKFAFGVVFAAAYSISRLIFG
ncbi:MAG: hypothetical protein AB7V18_04185 [Pyrinomonadaceae bacterium]